MRKYKNKQLELYGKRKAVNEGGEYEYVNSRYLDSYHRSKQSPHHARNKSQLTSKILSNINFGTQSLNLNNSKHTDSIQQLPSRKNFQSFNSPVSS